ncbi:MAG: ATP-dependent sacrificial sulfur transferase LarE [Desulfobacterales bacterium]|nr:ATP-dependent sacrificial sulfur transferase LarE [Desulfobacterales bacterium]
MDSGTSIKGDLATKYQHLQNLLKEMKRVLIAFSGGVDSTLLLKVAKDTLGESVLAVTAVSETTPRHERLDAKRLARELEATHLMVDTHEMQIPEFVKNPENKCYTCKKYRFGKLIELAQKKDYRLVLDGGNLDDQSDYRPGIKATRELGVVSPLAEAGFSKQDVRALSKQLNLPTWNKPSYACLASRIPYHSQITAEKLKQVDNGEDFLRELGFSGQIRVRHHNNLARLEIDSQDLPRIIQPALRNKVIEHFKGLGFTYIALDLEGYSMGSLNRLAVAAQKGIHDGQQ